MAEAFILQEAEYSYVPGSPRLALGPLDLSVEEGEFLAVLGPNGSGKTTLAHLLNALLVPTRGRAVSFGLDTSDPANTWEIRRRVGMVLQSPDHQILGPTVEDDIAFGLENLGMPRERMRGEVERVLHGMRLAALRDREPHLLSAGQKQRLALAGVLAMSPRAIVSDECTALLDPRSRDEVIGALRRFNREQGMTVVHITHRLEEALSADRVLVLREGKPVLNASPHALLECPPLLEELGLELPAALRLVRLLQERGILPEGCGCEPDEVVRRLCP